MMYDWQISYMYQRERFRDMQREAEQYRRIQGRRQPTFWQGVMRRIANGLRHKTQAPVTALTCRNPACCTA